MRILLAVDGSATADRAVELVKSATWPRPTTVRVVIVDETAADLAAAPWLGQPLIDHGPSWDRTQALYAVVGGIEERLDGDEVAVEAKVLRGRAADEIVREAMAFGADLVVVGSRGLGTIKTMVLGSISAEVVDRSPCPVLVARTESVTRMVVGLDGSLCSDRALGYIVENGLFPGTEAIALSAVPHPPALLVAPMNGYVPDIGVDPEVRSSYQEVAHAGALRLKVHGRPVSEEVVEGDPPTMIIEAATRRGADLVVLGTRGATGVRRLLLGSTARNVLLHATCSVLIVRQRRAVRVEAQQPIAARLAPAS